MKQMRYIITSTLFILYLGVVAQGFRSRYYLPNAKNNTSKVIFETTLGNYIAGGLIVDSTYINRLCIMGLNSQGQLQWTKKYGSSKFMHWDNPFISNSYYKQGNYLYYTGAVYDSSSNSINKTVGVLIKFNMNGDTLWQKIYRNDDTLEDVIPQKVTASVDGGFLITGFFQNGSSGSEYSKCLLIKTDAAGNELWRQKIAKVTPNTQDGKAIVQDSASKKIVIVGYQYIGNASSWSSYNNILILDSLGVKITQKDWDGTGAGGYLLDMIQTQDKNFVAVGVNLYPQTIGGSNIRGSYIVKFDINNMANPIWKIYNFDKPEIYNGFTCIDEMANGDLIVGGILDTIYGLNLPINVFARITKFTKDGVLLGNRHYNYKINSVTSDNAQGASSINMTSDGGWVCALQVSNYPSPNPFFFVKYDSTGCDSSLTYCASVIAGGKELEIKDNRLKIYPNPSGALLNIQATVAVITNCKLKLINVLGQEEKLDEWVKQNDIITLNIQQLKKGIYFLQVFDNSKLTHTEKIVKE